MINRIKEFIDNQGISIRAFEQKIGASNGLIRKAIAKNTDIQSKWIECIVDNYPQISLKWLITGKGEMLDSKDQNPSNKVDNINNRDDRDIELLKSKEEIIKSQKEVIETQKDLILSLKQRLRDVENKSMTTSQTSTFRSVQSADTATGKYHKK